MDELLLLSQLSNADKDWRSLLCAGYLSALSERMSWQVCRVVESYLRQGSELPQACLQPEGILQNPRIRAIE